MAENYLFDVTLAFQQSGHEEIGEEEAQAENVQIKGNLKKEIISVASDELACEVMRSQSPTNGNFDQYDNSSTVDELEGLWMDMSLAMACSKVYHWLFLYFLGIRIRFAHH